ncbi:hypothetical protein [Dyadobacter sandarakinus]|uniref:hypothetical protein n=1 Tax=Dyadobacter sandarakinus TaxID=2747268 RepID=UPI0035B5BBD1
MNHYNSVRPHASLGYLTPNQAHFRSGLLALNWYPYKKTVFATSTTPAGMSNGISVKGIQKHMAGISLQLVVTVWPLGYFSVILEIVIGAYKIWR